MPVNYFVGRSREWLEEELRLAQEDFAAGKSTVGYNAGDVSASKVVSMEPRERIEQLLYALFLLDPVTYPAANIKRLTVTIARHNASSGSTT